MQLPFRRFVCVAGSIFLPPLCAHSAPDASSPTLPPLTVGKSTVGWNSADGLTLAFDGVPFVRKSSLYLVKAGWSGVLLDQSKAVPVIRGWQDTPGGGKNAGVTLETPDARCDYTFTVNAAGSDVTVDLAYRLKNDVPAAIEYAAGYMSGAVLQGARVSQSFGGPMAFVPVAAASPKLSQEARRLFPPVSNLRFDSRLGEIEIGYSGDAPKPVFFDGRRDAESWAKDYPVFWMGIGSPEQPVVFADGVRHAIFRYSFAAYSARAGAIKPAGGPLALNSSPASVTASNQAYAPTYAPTPLVLPRPKQMEVGPEFQTFHLNPKTRLIVRDGATAEDKRGAVLLQNEIRARYGFTPPLVAASAAKGMDNAIVLAEPQRTTGVLHRALLGLPPLKPEGYTVAVSPETVLVAGRDTQGTFWGAQTLIQLLAADAHGPVIRPVIIHDWPTLSLRGVHLFYGKNALPFQKKLIDRVLSRFKMNALFIQAEQAKWDADPQVAPDWGGTKTDLAAEATFARAHGMTLYPLIQGYGHMEWLFSRDRNRAFAEDPQTPYAVDFTNPAAVSYLTKFVDEADSALGAPGFHVGLDEIDMRGRFPYRSAPRTAPDLIVSAAKYWHDHLKARGKEMWMWADMALNHDDVAPSWGSNKSAADAAAIRAGLPKDIVMVDWQYSPRDSYPSLKRLKDAGFTQLVAATWFDAEGNQNFSKAAAAMGARGAMITTWAGYESKEDVLNGPERRQFVAMVNAADYFWNGGDGPAPDDLPYNAAEVFTKQWAGVDAAANRVRPGYTVDLSTIANRPANDWRGYGAADEAHNLPTAKITRLEDGTLYRLHDGVVLLAGRLNPADAPYPVSVTVPLAKPAREVRLLLAASHAAAVGTKIGTIHVNRTDGTTETVDLVYGTNIAALNDTRSLDGAETAWQGVSGAGEALSLRRVSVLAGKAAVQSVTVVSADTEAAPMVFAVNALTK